MELIELGFEPYLLYAGIGLVLTVVICFSSPKGIRASLKKPAAAIGLVLVWVLVSAPMIAMQRRSIEVSDGMLRIHSSFYSSETPLSDIKGIYEFAPGDGIDFGIRTNAIGVPGLSSGWFSSKGNRYFVDAVDGANLAIYQQKQKYIIALQVRDPLKTRDLLLDLAAGNGTGNPEQAGRAQEAVEPLLDELKEAMEEGTVGVEDGIGSASGAEADSGAGTETRSRDDAKGGAGMEITGRDDSTAGSQGDAGAGSTGGRAHQ